MKYVITLLMAAESSKAAVTYLKFDDGTVTLTFTTRSSIGTHSFVVSDACAISYKSWRKLVSDNEYVLPVFYDSRHGNSSTMNIEKQENTLVFRSEISIDDGVSVTHSFSCPIEIVGPALKTAIDELKEQGYLM